MSKTNQVKDKRHYYKTAKARIGCAVCKAGDYVSVKYDGRGTEGVHYFMVNGVANYPQHHLTEFCL